MPTANQAFVTPAVLRWARNRARETAETVAKKIGTKPEAVSAWESGESRPTFRQAEKLAAKLLVPFGYFFLPEPPAENIPLPDFRTMKGTAIMPTSDLMALLYDVLSKHWWYQELASVQGQPELTFVGKFTPDASEQTVASDIVSALEITDSLRASCDKWEEFLTTLIRHAESKGIIVMRGSRVPGTSRNIPKEEFRGFAISSSKRAPLIFVNSADARAAQLFTLAHELAHIWFGQTGISNERLTETPDSPIEAKCNAIAAEVLVPREIFLTRWDTRNTIDTNLQQLGRHFKVSLLVMLYRARDLGRISREDFRTRYRKEEERIAKQEKNQKEKQKDAEGGPSYYDTLIIRNSELFTGAVLEAASNESISDAEAANLLNVRTPLLPRVAEKLEKRRLRAAR